ncbi:helix-turn-helix transcriptional regulator [Oceaniglobus indicus]|uniref:helix-turn-helix transcriptional regulator n=1 Tax=Oceaniglobus indicus TaxID=2047749 RepID=UPI001F4E97A1|nr:AlpA family phage regulatory protein [Oceaniglobus indicus]
MNTYLAVEQVAVRFSVSKDTIWRWRREGDFPKPVKLGGRTTRWRLSDIEDWEAQCPCGFITSLPLSAAI